MPASVSAVVITMNAEARLAAVLASVAFCAERLVVDSGSTDATVAVARAAGARVEHQPFLGFGPQKRRAVELATHDWILSLDADETLDDEAARAVHDLDFTDPRACWEIRRRTFVGHREISHGPWGDDWVLRLFNRRTASFKPLRVHETVVPTRRPERLPGAILHHGFTSTADVLARSLRYAPLKAEIMRELGDRPTLVGLPLRGAAAFVKAYLARGGWRDGAAGFVIALARMVDSTLPRAMLLLDEREPASPAEPPPPITPT